tara:strand:+ start:194 stop:394 length:201 start_codon:yes stop_codon:yes gene_type:complete
MAGNVDLNAGAGGDTIAADDDGTAKHQYVKVEFGPDNTQTPVSATDFYFYRRSKRFKSRRRHKRNG